MITRGLLVASQFDHTVREYDGTTGAFVKVAASALGDPLGVVIGLDGNLLVSDGQTNQVKRYDSGTGAFIDVFASANLAGPTAEPHMSWPMPSKPCLWLHGPPAPNAVTAVRMMFGFTRRRLSRSSASPRNTSGGRFATTTSAVATSLRTTSRPSALDGSSVIARLLRFMTRNIAPTSSSPTGATHRSPPPPRRSIRMTSAPRSASNAAQYGPAMYRPKSRTRTPARTPLSNPSDSLTQSSRFPWSPAREAVSWALSYRL